MNFIKILKPEFLLYCFLEWKFLSSYFLISKKNVELSAFLHPVFNVKYCIELLSYIDLQFCHFHWLLLVSVLSCLIIITPSTHPSKMVVWNGMIFTLSHLLSSLLFAFHPVASSEIFENTVKPH